MDELKTISQIAKEIGCSRQAVYQRINSDKQLSSDLQGFTVKKGKYTLYTLQGQKRIQTAFSERTVKHVDSQQQSIDSKRLTRTVNEVDIGLQSLLDELRKDKAMLLEQIKVKDEQIVSLNSHISALTAALQAAQALHGIDKQHQPPQILDASPAGSSSEEKRTEREPERPHRERPKESKPTLRQLVMKFLNR